MKRHMLKKLNRATRRATALLLSALMLSGSVYAEDADERELRNLYGNDWQKVAALQPGDSYISGDNMYVCYETTYVDWTRVKSEADLNPSGWGNEERLLLMMNDAGKRLFVGNDYARYSEDLEEDPGTIELRAQGYNDVRKVLSGVTRDTSGNNAAEYTEEYVFPDLYRYFQQGYGTYPDTFRTEGTMNAPYLQYAGIDKENGNRRMFKIIMAKDDGSMSGVGLSHDDDIEGLQLRSVNECGGFTFCVKDGGCEIFEYIDDECYMKLHFYYSVLLGLTYESLEEIEKMSSRNAEIFLGKKSVGKRIEVLSLAMDDAEQNPDALENVYGGAVEFYRWEKVTSSSQLPTDSSKTYRALLVWEDKYFLQGDDFRKHSNNDGMALYVNEEKTGSAAPGNVAEVPEIDLSQDEFYTMGGMGTPYLKFKGRDGNKSNDNCPTYTFQLAGMDDQPSGKWLCDGDNVFDICRGEVGQNRYGGMAAGIVVGVEASSGNDAAPGKVKLFYNEGGGGRDTDFMYDGNKFYGDDCGWNGSEFTLYIGKPVVYPAVRQNYVVGEDQFVHISQNGAMFKNVTILVAKGGVLSVESWFMNNGRIVVDGGTLIVQNASNPLGDEMADDTEDSVMLPFADIHPLVSGSLELKNGGDLVVLDDARAVFSNIKATTGSSIFNCGILMAETIDLNGATVENRENGNLFIGYDFREIVSLRNGALSKINNDLASRLQSDVSCLIRRMHSSIHNDGKVTYSTGFSTYMDDSVRKSGSGSYVKVAGKRSRYMLEK